MPVARAARRKRASKGGSQQKAKRAKRARFFTEEEKDALKAQLLNKDLRGESLLVMTVWQPFASCFFKKTSPKDVEFRGWGIKKCGGRRRKHRFVLILSPKSCSKHRGKAGKDINKKACYTKKSKRLAAAAGDESLLVPLSCQKVWTAAQPIIERNGGRPGSGYPSQTILGLVLFEGELSAEQCKKHPWWVGDRFFNGTKPFTGKGLIVKKALRFPNPIPLVCGTIQGRPQNVRKSCWLGGSTCKDLPRLERSQTLMWKIQANLEHFYL